MALKEQDLQYAKRKIESLEKNLAELRQAAGSAKSESEPNSGGQQASKFDALRKEIELNEKL